MTEFFWRLAMEGDHAFLGNPVRFTRGNANGYSDSNVAPFVRDGEPDDAFSYIDHALAVARATETAGFEGGLLPSFPRTEDPWAFASLLAKDTASYRFMVAYQPGFLHPAQVARQAATLQRASDGRLLFNVISGGGGDPQLWWGDAIDHASRYERTREFLEILQGVWGGEPFSYDGKHFQLDNFTLPAQLAGQPFPELYFSGSSDAAIAAAGAHADYYLSWLEPREQLAEKIRYVKEHAAGLGKDPKIAIRVEVVARRTPELAWGVIERAWQTADTRESDATSESVGARRAAEAVPTSDNLRDLEIEPNIWGGFDRLRPGPKLGIVGSYEQVAEELSKLVDIGVDSFILASVPHLEEAYRVGEEVLPLVR